jgi:hypothetical protein
MRLQRYINEEWMETYIGNKYEVLKNPSTSELNKLLKASMYGRFILDASKKNVYVWDASKAIHQTVYNKLHITGKTLFGIAQRVKGKWSMVNSDEVMTYIRYNNREYEEVIKNVLNKFLWANSYIDIKHFIKLMKTGDYYEDGF